MLRPDHPWYAARHISFQIAPEFQGGFDIGFDRQIPEDTKCQLREFVSWVEKNFEMPIPLWVDFEYRHYLIDRSKQRVGYLFYWSDFPSHPVFSSRNDMPVIRLPVRTERSTFEEILASFIEAISCYFAWLADALSPDKAYLPDEDAVEEVLQAYLNRIADSEGSAP